MTPRLGHQAEAFFPDPHDRNFLLPLFFDIYATLPRQGPGSPSDTRRAFSMLSELPDRPRILDVGCGVGRQTLDLAELSRGSITAVDLHAPFIETLRRSVDRLSLNKRVRAIVADMADLPFAPGSFDLVWSEGALYFLGFEAGLRSMRKLLANGGYLAATELTWLETDPPGDVASFFASEYPAMTTIEENRASLRRAGFVPIGDFVLPDAAWWTDYYDPLQKAIDRARAEHASESEETDLLDWMQAEIDLFRRYSDWYGYVFYMGRRT